MKVLSKKEVLKLADKFLMDEWKEFFKYDYGMILTSKTVSIRDIFPKIKLTSRIGQVMGRFWPSKNLIEINGNYSWDEESLKPLIFHEGIHFFDSWFSNGGSDERTGHGAFFRVYMREINAKYGKDYITIKHTLGKGEKLSKKIWVIYAEDNHGDIQFLISKSKKVPSAIFFGMSKIFPKLDFYVAKSDMFAISQGTRTMFPTKNIASGSSLSSKNVEEFYDSLSDIHDVDRIANVPHKKKYFVVYDADNKNAGWTLDEDDAEVWGDVAGVRVFSTTDPIYFQLRRCDGHIPYVRKIKHFERDILKDIGQ